MRILLVSHGDFSQGILSSAQMIVGNQDNITALGLYPQNSVEDLEHDIENEIQKAAKNEDVLIISDLFSGSPFNAVARLMHKYPRVRHITGMNLPLVLEVVMKRNMNMDIKEISFQAVESAKNAIIDVNRYLEEAD